MVASEIQTKFKTNILKPLHCLYKIMFVQHYAELCSQHRHHISQHYRYLLQKNLIMIHGMSCRVLHCRGSTAWLLCYWSFIHFHQLQKSWNRTDCTWGSLTHRLLHIKELYYQNHHIPFLILQRCLLLFSRHSQSMNIRLGITKPVPAVGPSVLFKVLKGQGT